MIIGLFVSLVKKVPHIILQTSSFACATIEIESSSTIYRPY